MKKTIFILTLFLLLFNPVFAAKPFVQKEYTTQAADGFTIKSTLEYNRVKGKKDYHTVVLLHSLGYSSQWWDTLPQELINNGYAVLMIDLRGHGKSVFNKSLVRMSWNNMTNNAFAKYPNDVKSVIKTVTSENSKTTFFNTWAIIGSDIGASTAIIATDEINNKPKTMVFLSPVVNTKGLYTPVHLAYLNHIDIFSISGTEDTSGKQAEEYLKRFSQSTFATYTSESKSNGMLLLKNDKQLAKIITSWLKEYL